MKLCDSAAMNEVKLARSFYVAEKVGGVFYDRFCDHVRNSDVAEAFTGFAGDEHQHAHWYAEWLRARGEALPNTDALERLLLPSLRIALAPQSLALKLQIFAATEAAAERHLQALARRVRDPALRAIVEKTIPFEHKHSVWYESQGRRMMRRRDYVF
jgi:rubrerythrin